MCTMDKEEIDMKTAHLFQNTKPAPIKTETTEEFLARGGKIKKVKSEDQQDEHFPKNSLNSKKYTMERL